MQAGAQVYIQKHFEQLQRGAMHALIREYPLATLVSHGADGLCADHIPMLLSPETGPNGLLSAHLPRANSLWRDVGDVLAIFHGPDAYISPNWYATKRQSGKVVPTWNYLVVHAHGRLRAIDDATWLQRHLDQMTRQQEASFEHPWTLADAPQTYTSQLIGHLVGVEISIDRLEGKWKVSQNRSIADRVGVIAGLHTLGTDTALEMAKQVELANDCVS